MAITFDPTKRALTLETRGLDFADAGEIFAGRHVTVADERFSYGEHRWQTAGFLNGRIVVIIWTPRGADRRIISMRHCHGKEERRIRKALG